MAGQLPYGYGFRQNLQQSQPTPQQGQSDPAMEALKQAIMAQQYDDRGDMIRGSIRRPTEAKNLISTGFDLWRMNNAEKKSREADLEAAKQKRQAETDSAAAQKYERAMAAKSVAEYIMSNGGTPEQAEKIGDMVYYGQIEAKDVIPKEAEKSTGTEAEYQALKEIYGPEKAQTMLATKYQGQAPEKPTGKEAEFQFLASKYGEEKALEMMASGYKGEGDESANLPVSKIGAENRVKLGLIKNSADLASRAIPILFDGDEFRNTQALVPKSEVSIALSDMRESLQSMLRAVSGAAIPETEIDREVNMMLPSPTDNDKQAREKINRAIGKINNLYGSLSAGYDLPEQMIIPELTAFGKTSEPDDMAELRKKYGLD